MAFRKVDKRVSCVNRKRGMTITYLHGCSNEADRSTVVVGKIIPTHYIQDLPMRMDHHDALEEYFGADMNLNYSILQLRYIMDC